MERPAARVLPTGTVSFLFSDVEGSTSRWETHREQMQAAMRRHDAIFGEVAAAFGGAIFKTIGDAFCIAFATAPVAIAAALDVQRALAREDWTSVDGLRVRMAVHTGDADERDGDYFGPVVNRVARLLASGHGGQILVSGITADLAQGALPPLTALRDLGSHRLKDLAYPEQVYQLTGAELDAQFPPLRTLDALPNNLPLQLTSFLGREEQVAEIRALFDRSRLVTLVGSGGVGKTRTSLQVAAEMLDRFPDGVWFVELAPLRDPSVIETVVLSVMGISGGSTGSVSALDLLRTKRALLVFDNCEHLVREAASVVDRILRGCAHISIIASSREGLAIGGEAVFRMPSLTTPPQNTTLTAQDVASYGAVALFVDRAQAFDRDFVLTDENAAVVGEICRQLDGIALAIELAAPRMKTLSPKALLERLTERFRLLTGGSRAALPRQQTMRALIDWSYDLLSLDERRVFRRVSVFAGGWTIEGATAVCTDQDVEEWDLLDILAALVDKSLIVTERSGDEQRYRMLESTRQYARERLLQSGEQQRFLERHASYFMEFVLGQERMRWEMTTLDVKQRSDPERDNVRSALTWALVERFDTQLGVALAAYAQATLSGHPIEVKRWLALAQPFVDASISRELQARFLLACAMQGNHSSTLDALDSALAAVDSYRTLDDPVHLAMALSSAARQLCFLERQAEAAPLAAEALAIGSARGLPLLQGTVLMTVSLAEADPAQRIRLLEQALFLFQARGDDLRLVSCLSWLAEDEFANGLNQRALSRGLDIVARRRAFDARSPDFGFALNNAAAYALATGDHLTARTLTQEALGVGLDQLAEITVVISLQMLAACAARAGNVESASRVLGYSRDRWLTLGRAIEYTEQSTFDTARTLLVRALGEERFEQFFTAGKSLTQERAIAEALSAS